MDKINCWEFMKCGQGPSFDENGASFARCPVAAEILADGLNSGINGGRICWVIAEKLKKNPLLCSPFYNTCSCATCKFHARVKDEEGLGNICRTVGTLLLRITPDSH
ncbi:MAG: hypothetical protein HY808_10455 [Nitrospirae bacterium]|nr:hypothetical protein [Nitrospirota bacterium]